MGLFNKIKNVFLKDKEAAKYEEGLTKTRKEFSTELAKLSKKYKNIDDDYFEELENILIMADIGSFSPFFYLFDGTCSKGIPRY